MTPLAPTDLQANVHINALGTMPQYCRPPKKFQNRDGFFFLGTLLLMCGFVRSKTIVKTAGLCVNVHMSSLFVFTVMYIRPEVPREYVG
jgi:hypothetical protein